ncbi:MAG: hypothetical protein RLZ22_492, partial [Verrucomicrobiota bacterium]
MPNIVNLLQMLLWIGVVIAVFNEAFEEG